MYAIAAEFGKLFGIIGFAVVCQYQTSERDLLTGYRMEEHAQLFRLVVTGKYPDKFFVLQLPEVGIMRSVRYISGNRTH